ncbi:MAG: hypothetical protein ACRBEQ_07365 [Hyphomonas sp.]
MPASTQPTLLAQPDWISAGRTLASGIRAQKSDADRLDLLLEVCDQLGDTLYPAFIKLLTAVGRFGSDDVCTDLSSTLGLALERSRLPSGRLGAWGLNRSAGRKFGPVEYLCASQMNAGTGPEFSADDFCAAIVDLTKLLSSDPKTFSLYIEKLHQDAQSPIEGSFSRSARLLINELAGFWQRGLADELLDQSLRDSLNRMSGT